MLYDDINIDSRGGQRSEHHGCYAGPIGHTVYCYLGAIQGVGYCGYNGLLHALLFREDPGAGGVVETGTHVQCDSVPAGELNATQHQDFGAGAAISSISSYETRCSLRAPLVRLG